MFYLLKEDRKFLIELWDDIVNNEDIDPYSELNIDLIENYNRFFMPDDDIPLLFVDDEYGLCGCAVLIPLETREQHSNMLGHDARWILHAVNIFLKKSSSIVLHPEIIKRLKAKFYTQLRQAVCELLQLEGTNGLLILSEDVTSQKEFQYYTRFVITHETNELDKKGNIIGIIPDIRLYLNEKHVFDSSMNSTPNNVVFLKAAFK